MAEPAPPTRTVCVVVRYDVRLNPDDLAKGGEAALDQTADHVAHDLQQRLETQSRMGRGVISLPIQLVEMHYEPRHSSTLLGAPEVFVEAEG